MPNYIIIYHGGQQPESKAAGAANREKWIAWISDLGDAVVNSGTPLSKNKLVTSDGVLDAGPDGLTGYSVVTAENMEAAIEMAKECPYLEMGDVEVAEMMQMG